MEPGKTYLAIDIKTTGLLPAEHQILEIGVVLADWSTPIDRLPCWSALIQHHRIVGHPTELARNAEVISKIGLSDEWLVQMAPDLPTAYRRLDAWLRLLWNDTASPKLLFMLACRNELIRSFLEQEPVWDLLFTARGQTMVPGPLFYKQGEPYLPRLDECHRRAGINRVYHDPRRAISAAACLVQLLRLHYGVRID